MYVSQMMYLVLTLMVSICKRPAERRRRGPGGRRGPAAGNPSRGAVFDCYSIVCRLIFDGFVLIYVEPAMDPLPGDKGRSYPAAGLHLK